MADYIGLGLCACGVAPYGYGTPATAPVPGGKPFMDDNGIQQDGAYIDPTTKKYSYNSYGLVKGESRVRQMVKLALMTVRGSSVLSTMGNNFRSILDIGSDFQSRVRDEAEACLQPLVKQGLVQFVEATVEQLNPATRVLIHVRYRDLTTGQVEVETV